MSTDAFAESMVFVSALEARHREIVSAWSEAARSERQSLTEEMTVIARELAAAKAAVPAPRLRAGAFGWRMNGYTDSGHLGSPLIVHGRQDYDMSVVNGFATSTMVARCIPRTKTVYSMVGGQRTILNSSCDPIPGEGCSCGIYFLPTPAAAWAFHRQLHMVTWDCTVQPPRWRTSMPRDFDIALTLIRPVGRVALAKKGSEMWGDGRGWGDGNSVPVLRAERAEILAILVHPWDEHRVEFLRETYDVPVYVDEMKLDVMLQVETDLLGAAGQ